MKRSCPSLTRKVKCRFCGEEIRERNYKLHLQRKHPNENGNSTDNRGAGQISISAFIKPKNNKNVHINSLAEIMQIAKKTAVPVLGDEVLSEDLEILPCAANNEVPVPGVEVPSEGLEILLCADKDGHESVCSEQQQLIEMKGGNAFSVNNKLDEILKHVKNLENEIVSLKRGKSENFDKKCVEECEDNSADLNYLFQSCRSITDITNLFDEFDYNTSTCCFICRICIPVGNPMRERSGLNSHPAIFVYDPECGIEFSSDCNLPAKFRFLKKHLKEHLLSKAHQCNLELREENEKKEEKYQKREREIGLRIGRIAYKFYFKGRPYSDFEEEIAISISNGCDLGDINHSEAFVKNFLPIVSESVASRLKKFLNKRLTQTGFQPPVKIIADKATWKHRTRHFVMIMTVVPDSDTLIHALYLGHPVMKAHTGKAVAESITSVISEWDISIEQYIGGSFDGQYFNLGVPKYLNEYFTSNAGESVQKEFIYDWDPMHKAGLVDDHMRQNEKCDWVVKMTQTIGAIFSDLNWGKDYENLRDTMMKLESNFRNPCFYSITRFANSVKKVYENFRIDYQGIISVLEEKQVESLNGNSIQKQKATHANLLKNKILNLKFCLRLSGLCDLYDTFSKIIDILQKVDILPHERYDSFIKKVNHLKRMSSTINELMCPCKLKQACVPSESMEDQIKCFWPCYHSDKELMESEGEYQGVPIFLPEPEDSFNLTRSQGKKPRLDTNNVNLIVEKELEDFSLLMAENFNDSVFTAEDVVIVNHVRNITDLKLLATKLKLKGIPLTAASHIDKFMFSAKKLVYELKDISTSELQCQYRTFLRNLVDITKQMPEKEFRNLRSIDIIKTFLCSKESLHQNVELILHSICVASIALSIESVCESLTSRYEHRNNKRRPISEETAHHELMICVNGPLPTKCDGIILEAMSKYFAKQGKSADWHFVRHGQNIKEWITSKSVDKLMKRSSPLAFMDT